MLCLIAFFLILGSQTCKKKLPKSTARLKASFGDGRRGTQGDSFPQKKLYNCNLFS